MIERTITERLYPSKVQEARMLDILDQGRWLYNYFLGLVKCCREVPKRTLLQELIPALCRYRPELEDVHSKTRQHVLAQLYYNISVLSALKKGGKKVGSLRFKGKGWYKSFVYNQSGFSVECGQRQRRQMGYLHLSKIGDIPIRIHRPASKEKTIKQVVIKRTAAGKWFAFFVVEQEQPIITTPIEKTKHVGLDMDIINYVYDSDGNHVEHPHNFDRLRKKLRREQRRLARKDKGSNNRRKQLGTVNSMYERITERRNNFIHKLSRRYINDYDVIGIEDLNIKGLMRISKNARNTADASWSRFFRMLEYKAESACTLVVRVPSAGSSIECSRCHKMVPKTLAVRTHFCPHCGLEVDRDYNASRIVDQRAMQRLGWEASKVTPVETEPPPTGSNAGGQAPSMKQELLQSAMGEAHGFSRG